MSLDVITLQPEVEEILREVARRPGSALLRVPRKDVARTVLERDTVVHARTAGLSAAERHLVQVYREEVAFALRQAAYYRLAHGDSSQGFMADRALASLRNGIPGLETVRTAASVAARAAIEAGTGLDTRELLEQCVVPDSGEWPSPGQLAAAAHRLVPTSATRIYASLDLRACGQLQSALSPLWSIVAFAGHGPAPVVAWSNVGDLLFKLGRYQDAWAAANRACEAEPLWVIAQSNRAVCALFLGDHSQIQQSIDGLEQALAAIPGASKEYTTWCSTPGTTSRSLDRRAISRALKSVSFHRQPLSSEVLHALSK